VLGSLAFVAVREEHRETRLAVPLGLTSRDELINDDL
jgi:hypothetical protein